ncbi:diguanylate cyclase [Lacibacterium aquatile]|uniref:diguanylate cyclase n=1 Tax=Lacibacterium aquatile TaxID=1168082 RepID=A0ABW5DTR7_9PROT
MSEASRILVVEDSRFFSQLVSKGITDRMPQAEVTVAASLAETQAIVAAAAQPFHLALVDLVLPDSKEGEALDFVQSHSIPCIVFTSVFSADLRERLFADQVIDYVLKDTPSSLDHLLSLVEQLHRNRTTKIMVVDDSRTARHYLRDLLRSYHFQVVEAANGNEALDRLKTDTSIRLVLMDYHMPDMDGIEMTRRIRAQHPPDRLALIGVSSVGSHTLSAQFIKHGANDFLNKPFLREEFFCRVVQNLRMLDLLDHLRESASRDFLTGLHNRRFFYESGASLMATAKRGQISLTAAIVDVDFFKQTNDTYGHEAGDLILRKVAECLTRHLRESDMVARIGGEEFALLTVNMAPDSASDYFEELRQAISEIRIVHGGKSIGATVSIGVHIGSADNLPALIDLADQSLYKAKAAGRNTVHLTRAD